MKTIELINEILAGKTIILEKADDIPENHYNLVNNFRQFKGLEGFLRSCLTDWQVYEKPLRFQDLLVGEKFAFNQHNGRTIYEKVLVSNGIKTDYIAKVGSNYYDMERSCKAPIYRVE